MVVVAIGYLEGLVQEILLGRSNKPGRQAFRL